MKEARRSQFIARGFLDSKATMDLRLDLSGAAMGSDSYLKPAVNCILGNL